jgi:hypothetical protein
VSRDIYRSILDGQYTFEEFAVRILMRKKKSFYDNIRSWYLRERNIILFKKSLKQIALLDRFEAKHSEISGFRCWRTILENMNRIYQTEK